VTNNKNEFWNTNEYWHAYKNKLSNRLITDIRLKANLQTQLIYCHGAKIELTNMIDDWHASMNQIILWIELPDTRNYEIRSISSPNDGWRWTSAWTLNWRRTLLTAEKKVNSLHNTIRHNLNWKCGLQAMLWSRISRVVTVLSTYLQELPMWHRGNLMFDNLCENIFLLLP
jgi:hypothetical protein